MRILRNYLKFLFKNEQGQGLMEYSLIISLIILAVIGVVTAFGEELKLYYENNIVGKIP